MLREAAVLGVPTVTIFHGTLGAVDRWLVDQGRVRLVRSDDDLRRIRLQRRAPHALPDVSDRALTQMVDGICATARRG